jgi:hypothetical protein
MRTLMPASVLVLALAPALALAGPTFGPNWVENSKKGKVFLVQPDDYEFVDVVDNPVMTYDLAMRHSSGRVEARWKVLPIAEGEIPSPAIQLTALSANISAAVMSPLTEFPTADVGRDYYAHWGGLIVIQPKAGFADDYPVAVLVGLHRDAKAMVYGIFLCKDLEADMDLMSSAYSALKFSEALDAPAAAPEPPPAPSNAPPSDPTGSTSEE